MEGILHFRMVGLDNKNNIKHYKNSLKQLTLTGHGLQEGLLSEGFLGLRFGWLIFGRAYLFICYYFLFLGGGLLSEF